MAKGTNQKLKMLYLQKIFSEKTDETHGLTIPEITDLLNDYGVNADRKTLYQDFEELRHYGFDIGSEKHGNQVYYKLLTREFELAELKLLVDAVQSSNFITEKKSNALIKKLESLVSENDARQLHRQVVISGRVKTMNESIYYLVDEIQSAILDNKQISFIYRQWNIDKTLEAKHDGASYVISPMYLMWDDENYYLIGYDSNEKIVKHFRVDKMHRIKRLPDNREGQNTIKRQEITTYSRKLFGMFGGESCRVEIVGENDMVGIFIDRFGKDIPVIPYDDKHFKAVIEVVPSDQFIGWIIGLGSKIKVVSPEPVIEKIRKVAENISSNY